MKILITGASGLLGKSLLETAPKEYQITATYKSNHPKTTHNWHRLDITDRAMVCDLFEQYKPNIIIHCASIGSVDYTDAHAQKVRGVNVTGLGNVIDIANGFKSKIIYISSNAVFGGNNPPYNEKSVLEPVNSYGVIKREAELLLQRTAKKWLIFRPFMLYGWPFPGGRANWGSSIISKLQSNDRGYKLVDDITWMPTYAPDCALAIWQLLNEHNQIFNVASPERATLYEFGLKACDVFELPKNLLNPVKSDYFHSIAKRPKDTTYDLAKLNRHGIMLSDIKTGLEKMREAKK